MRRYLFTLILVLLTISCSQNQNEENISIKIAGDSIEMQMSETYNEGILALKSGDVLYAAKKFNEAEMLYPQSIWAPRASLMAAYAYWTQNYYNKSVEELKRFLKVYPKDNNIDYAYYLLAINYYDSIINEKKDLRPINESKKYFTILVNEFPNTDYALDAKYKLGLIQDYLAAKEMFIARHYIKKEKWIAAINRLNVVIAEYDRTIYIEEALHRIVEVYYRIGLEEEAKKYAQLLGYNYQSSSWYEQSYKIFNRNYKIKNIEKDKKKIKLLNKIKSFLNE
jgi:outer membrane protein assembly factor BamD